MQDFTNLSSSPREEILSYLRVFARIYSPESDNETEAREAARLAAYPIGRC